MLREWGCGAPRTLDLLPARLADARRGPTR